MSNARATGLGRPRSGSATVELAVVLPLVLLLVFGMFEFGLQMYVRHRMVVAAREAAREVAVQGGDCEHAVAAAQSRLADINAEFDITIREPPPMQDIDRDVRVTVSTPRSTLSIGFFAFSPDQRIVVDVVMRKEGG